MAEGFGESDGWVDVILVWVSLSLFAAWLCYETWDTYLFRSTFWFGLFCVLCICVFLHYLWRVLGFFGCRWLWWHWEEKVIRRKLRKIKCARAELEQDLVNLLREIAGEWGGDFESEDPDSEDDTQINLTSTSKSWRFSLQGPRAAAGRRTNFPDRSSRSSSRSSGSSGSKSSRSSNNRRQEPQKIAGKLLRRKLMEKERKLMEKEEKLDRERRYLRYIVWKKDRLWRGLKAETGLGYVWSRFAEELSESEIDVNEYHRDSLGRRRIPYPDPRVFPRDRSRGPPRDRSREKGSPEGSGSPEGLSPEGSPLDVSEREKMRENLRREKTGRSSNASSRGARRLRRTSRATTSSDAETEGVNRGARRSRRTASFVKNTEEDEDSDAADHRNRLNDGDCGTRSRDLDRALDDATAPLFPNPPSSQDDPLLFPEDPKLLFERSPDCSPRGQYRSFFLSPSEEGGQAFGKKAFGKKAGRSRARFSRAGQGWDGDGLGESSPGSNFSPEVQAQIDAVREAVWRDEVERGGAPELAWLTEHLLRSTTDNVVENPVEAFSSRPRDFRRVSDFAAAVQAYWRRELDGEQNCRGGGGNNSCSELPRTWKEDENYLPPRRRRRASTASFPLRET